MKLPVRIFRSSNVRQELDAEHIKAARASVADSRKVLEDNPMPDTFVGRKTHEPFAPEDLE